MLGSQCDTYLCICIYIVIHDLNSVSGKRLMRPIYYSVIIWSMLYLQPYQQWLLNNIPLNQCDNIKYLGVDLSYIKPYPLGNNHIKACRNACYALQGVGLFVNDWSVDTVVYVCNTAIRPVLTGSIQCSNMNKRILGDKIQTRLSFHGGVFVSLMLLNSK